jgi:cytochrome c peroxidase
VKKLLILAGAVTLIVAVQACSREESNPSPDPKPLSVEVPSYVRSFVGDLVSPSDNPLTEEGVALGRKLFYEKMLSDNSTLSCASCHKQENAFDDPRPFSEGTHGVFGDRNAMAIVNAGWDKGFFWDGRRNSLEGQAHDPVTNPIEMANTWPVVVERLQNTSVYPELFKKAFGTTTIDSNLVVKAIAQFERTLVSFNSKFDKYYHQGDTTVFTQQEKNGLNIFINKGLCNHCHVMNSLVTDREFRNNGLDVNPADAGLMKFTGVAADKGKFKVPTLRNIAVSGPYMHDSRFTTLEAVVEHYSSGIKSNSVNLDEHLTGSGSGMNFTAQEKADLVAFLKTLTDQSFLTNPAFSDPN